MHFLTFGFKTIFAIIPPPSLMGGWPCFFGALTFIAIFTLLISDLGLFRHFVDFIFENVFNFSGRRAFYVLTSFFCAQMDHEFIRTFRNKLSKLYKANIFGCLISLKPAVNAITLVAMGTSLPDLFASKTAAVQEEHADNSVGNVTGSNSVNVFLGLGLPWTIAAIYWTIKE